MERIGRYRIIGELGRGAMGVVYRAEDPAIGRTVAIKTIRLGDLTDTSEREFMRERLRREARSAGMLSHPGIVTIYDIFEEGDTAYVLMEFVNGESLDKTVSQKGKLAKDRIFDVLRQTAAALDYAHGKGIVHRDIKPANIMISVDGQAKITDFGVAKILSQQMTQTRSVLGTPYYMSPEQIQGGQIDGRSDQFALAVIAFELMTGERPYAADSLPTLLFKIVQEEPPAPHRLNPSLAAEVGKVFDKAFRKEPDTRFANCTEFVNVLAVAANRRPDWEPLAAGSAGVLDTAAGSPVSLPPAMAAEPQPPSPPSKPEPTKVSQPAPVLPRIPKTRTRAVPPEERESHLARNVILVVLLIAIIAGGVFAYYEYILPMQPFGTEVESPDIAAGDQPADPSAGEFPAPPPPETPGVPADTAGDAREAAQADSPPPPPETAESETGAPAASAPPAESEAPPPPAAAKQAPQPKPQPAPAKAAQTHWVQVRSRPPGATVTADDDPELTCKTPCEIPLREGRHVLNFTLAGHRLAPRIIRVPDLTDVTVSLTREAGTLAIRTTPPGATIFINGEQRQEKTPAMIKLPAGRYRIRLSLPGHPDFEDSVEVRDQVITTFGIDW